MIIWIKITIIIPAYNESLYVTKLLERVISVPTESVGYNKEIIFIDDGSSDGSSEWLIDLASNNKSFKLIQFYFTRVLKMFATNPFSILAETVPSVVMQGFVVLMVLLIYLKK